MQRVGAQVAEQPLVEQVVVLAERVSRFIVLDGIIFAVEPSTPNLYSSCGVFFWVCKLAVNRRVSLLPFVSVNPAETLLFQGYLISATAPGARVLVLVSAKAARTPATSRMV